MGVVLGFFFVVFALLLVVFFLIFKKSISKKKNDFWTGEVLDKNESEWDNEIGGSNTYYKLKIKTEDGKVIYTDVSKEIYDQVSIGDKLKKEKGSSLPEKI